MALDFPSSPTDGQSYTSGNITYSYSTTANGWLVSYPFAGITANSDNHQLLQNDNGSFRGTPGVLYFKTSDLFQVNTLTVLANVTAQYYTGDGQHLTNVGIPIFAKTNSAFAKINVAYAQANLVFNSVNVAANQANTAREKANTGWTHANLAFEKANTANITGDLAYLVANQAFFKANGVVQTGFIVLTSDSPGTNISPVSNTDVLNFRGANGITAFGTNSGSRFMNVALNQTAVTAGTYGASNTVVPYFIVDAWGRITGAGNTVVGNAFVALTSALNAESNSLSNIVPNATYSGNLTIATNRSLITLSNTVSFGTAIDVLANGTSIFYGSVVNML